MIKSLLSSKPSILETHSYRPLALAIAIALSAAPTISKAATYTVMNTNDSGAGSLRQAVLDANANTGADEILFDSSITGETITLISGELRISDSSVISGPTENHPSSITIDGGGNSRVFHISDSSLILDNITISGGIEDSGGISSGGGLYSQNSNITLNHTNVSDNFIYGELCYGAGIFIYEGALTLNNSSVSNNTTKTDINYGSCSGNGIHARSAIVKVNSSTISNNNSIEGPSRGGGLNISGGEIQVTNSTISSNSVNSSGGGIFAQFVTKMDIEQSTISGNNAIGGGGIQASYSPTTINQSTIINNSSLSSAGGGAFIEDSISIKNTILSGNTGPLGNLYFIEQIPYSYIPPGPTPIFNITNSLFGDESSEITGTDSNNIFNNSPDLGPIKDNGGPTLTHLPNLTSPALNTGSNSDIPLDTDQRGSGFTRIFNGTVDIGAVEVFIPPKPIEAVKRNEIVKLLLQASLGDTFIPDEANGTEYTDVATGDFNADWIEKFKIDGFTEGCAVDRFCPNSILTKAELAKFVIKVKLGFDYSPMPATGIYADVAIGSFNADWIETLNLEGITMGCDIGKFCPEDVVTVEVFNNVLNSAFP